MMKKKLDYIDISTKIVYVSLIMAIIYYIYRTIMTKNFAYIIVTIWIFNYLSLYFLSNRNIKKYKENIEEERIIFASMIFYMRFCRSIELDKEGKQNIDDVEYQTYNKIIKEMENRYE